MTHATGTIGNTQYAVSIDMGRHHILADEGAIKGGADSGPAPYDLLLAALVACTSITLRMYADRKQWNLKSLTVEVRFAREGQEERIDRTLRIEGNLDEEQRRRMVEIAERTPVTLTLKRGLSIFTTLDNS